MAEIEKRFTKGGEPRYRARIKIKRDGKIVHSESRTFKRLPTARSWARERELELEKPGSLERVTHDGVIIASLIDRYVDEVRDLREYGRSKHAALRQLKGEDIAQLDALELTPRDILDHLKLRRERGAAASTVEQDLIWLRVVLKYAKRVWGVPIDLEVLQEAGETGREVQIIAKSKKRNRRPTADELRRLTEHFRRKTRSAVPMDLVMWFAIYSARRQSEIFELVWSDMSPEAGTYLARDLKHPDGSAGNNKRALLPPAGWAVLDALKERAGQTDERVFPYSGKTVSTYFTNACKILGIEDLRFHDLRHEACSRLAEDGKTIPEIQQVSLHDSWSSLQRYVQVTRQDRVEWGE